MADVLGSADGVSPAAGAASPVGLLPSQVASYYGINAITFNSSAGVIKGDGTGQTIAIVDLDYVSNIQAELTTFDTTLGIAAPPSFTVAFPYGKPIAAPIETPSGWGAETALDVEWAHAMAPGASILLVEVPSADIYQGAVYAAQQPGVSVVSMSWGSAETAGETAYDSDFLTPQGHSGVAFVAASGDQAAPGLYPAASPNVLAVGGTSFITNSQGTITGEVGWNDSGGGISPYEAQPAYQQGVVSQSSSARTIPDVSVNAGSPMAVFDSYDLGTTGWEDLSGTSFGSPTVAALIAITDQGAVAAGGAPLSGAQVSAGLYSLFSKTGSESFNDITVGNNGYAAGPGYDLVTGLGSPQAGVVAAALSGNLVAPTLSGPSGSMSTTAPTFQWSSVSGAVSYQLAVFNQATGTEVLDQSVTGATSYSTAVGTFLPGQSYTWKVTAIPAAGSSKTSAVVSFGVPGIPVATPTSPANGATVATAQPTFQWSAAAGAAYYGLVVTDAAAPGTPVVSTLVSGTSYTPGAQLIFGHSYIWTVTAYETLDGVGFAGSPSTAFTFTQFTASTPQSPLTGSVVSTTPTFTWGAVSGAASYQITIVDESTNQTLGPFTVSGTAYTPAAPLVLGDTFQWQVQSADVAGSLSQPTAAQMFLTSNVPSDAPIVTTATTPQNSPSSSGLVVTPNPNLAAGVTNFLVTQITGGTLYLSDGVTPVADDSFITLAQAAAGLAFTPTATGAPANGSFLVQASTTADISGLVGSIAPATVTVTAPVAHTPTVTVASTLENTQSTSGLVITPNGADVGVVTNYQITGITGGTLYQNDGVTQITDGEFITLAQGAAGLKFTPTANSTGNGSFSVQASTSDAVGGLGGSTVQATIAVTPVIESQISSVTQLPARTSLTSFTVSWSATDPADVADYDIFVSVDDGPYAPWSAATATTATSATFTATLGHTYAFYSQAIENSGAVEAPHAAADTTVVTTPTPWQNPTNPLDVLGTGGVVPADALAVINALNSGEGGSLPASQPVGAYFLDVLGTNTLVPGDALAIINYLNLNGVGAVAPAPQPAIAAAASASGVETVPAVILASATEAPAATAEAPSPAAGAVTPAVVSAAAATTRPAADVGHPQSLGGDAVAVDPLPAAQGGVTGSMSGSTQTAWNSAIAAKSGTPGGSSSPGDGSSPAGDSAANHVHRSAALFEQSSSNVAAVDAVLADASVRWMDGV